MKWVYRLQEYAFGRTTVIAEVKTTATIEALKLPTPTKFPVEENLSLRESLLLHDPDTAYWCAMQLASYLRGQLARAWKDAEMEAAMKRYMRLKNYSDVEVLKAAYDREAE